MELSKRKIEVYASLGTKKMREKYGLFVVEGRKSVEDTLDLFRAEAVILKDGSALPAGIQKDVPVYEAKPLIIGKMSQLSTPPDVIAIYNLPQRLQLEEIDIDSNQLYLLLDGVQDPGNLGTILRTAHWFGVTTLFASQDTVDIFNPKTIQSTMGSLGRVKICYCDLERLIRENAMMPVYGTLLEGENIYKSRLENRGFIVMGNEGKGISAPLRELISQPLLIPPYSATDHSESLNVAIATGIVLSQFRMDN